ncbi:hypothetical protein HJFPF1_06919 [Paramyrothecium foliicola]|nr:hypothetical protein HJFPF1_06919 [Paramyrothecium foliicola]
MLIPYVCDAASDSSEEETPWHRYSFELEFMVAQEITGQYYKMFNEEDVDSTKWACDAAAVDPVRACLNQCAAVFQNEVPVVICYDPATAPHDLRLYPFNDIIRSHMLRDWYLEPASTVVPRDGSPANYIWIGLRLRSPFLPETELEDPDSNVTRYLAALRRSVRLHVNSTCKFNVQVHPGPRPLDLIWAKKLATLVLMLESNMILPLCPDSDFSGSKHSLFDVLKSKMMQFRGSDLTRPTDADFAHMMIEHIPFLTNPTNQQMRENGLPAAFALHPYNERVESPTVEFRYGLWHPYRGADVSDYWCRLACYTLTASDKEPASFKNLIAFIDPLIHGSASEFDQKLQWVMLMNRAGFEEELCIKWSRAARLYEEGSMLDRRNLDRQGCLRTVMRHELGYSGSR